MHSFLLLLGVAITVSFTEDRWTVDEGDGSVTLMLIAEGAVIGTPFTVQVDPEELIPPSARGERVIIM